MAMEYTAIDKALAESVLLRFQTVVLGKDVIEFQFPPKITSDNRKGDWQDTELPSGTEPMATYKASGAREMTLTYTYIVDGDKWPTQRIADNIKRVRGYFAQIMSDQNNPNRNLVVNFKMWLFGSAQPITARIKGVSVKHSDTIVVPCVFGNNQQLITDKAFPLRSDVTIDLRLWTVGIVKAGDKPVQEVPGLPIVAWPPEWY